ncbi:MAG TPA: DnaJ domain-containing protein [Abditibacteriaceae bacterium]|nr:DnaJ domain-containing protein [Abditibacteriaceae bacterium]
MSTPGAGPGAGSTPGAEGPDHYRTLGVTPDAEWAVIKRQYRALVRQHHPDIATDKAAATRRMVLILEAWRVLSNPLERERYDRDCRERARRAAIAAAPPPHARAQTNGARPNNSRGHGHHAPPPAASRRSPPAARPAGSTPANRQSGKSRAARSGAARGSKAQAHSQRSRRLDKTVAAAQRSFAEGSTAEAITICKRILQLEPKNAAAAALLGDIFAHQGQYDMALLMYGRAAFNQPANPVYRWKLDSTRQAAAAATTATPVPDRPKSQTPRPAAARPIPPAAARKTTIYITAGSQLSRTSSRPSSRSGCTGPLLFAVALASAILTPLLLSLSAWIGDALP